jgi:hypothetical protein
MERSKERVPLFSCNEEIRFLFIEITGEHIVGNINNPVSYHNEIYSANISNRTDGASKNQGIDGAPIGWPPF